MNLLDTPNGYGVISRINHWLGALLVIGLLGVGLYFNDMPRGDEKMYWLRLHSAVGVLAFLPLLFRIGWRMAVTSPQLLPQPPMLQLATRAVHGLLLLTLAVLMVTGPFIVWSAGAPIDVFGWFELPSLTGKMPVLHEALEGVHAVTSKVLLVFIGVHMLATLKHVVVDRDDTLRRMLGGAA